MKECIVQYKTYRYSQWYIYNTCKSETELTAAVLNCIKLYYEVRVMSVEDWQKK